jgi:hypothetical protein
LKIRIMGADADKHWPSVAVGGNLNAVRFALENKVPILFNCFPRFHSYEPSIECEFSTLEEEWARCSYKLFEQCLNPFTNLVETIRVSTEEKKIRVHTKDNNIHCIKYDKLYLFDLENIFGLENFFSREITGYRVLDWFDTRSLGGVDTNDIYLDDNFVKSIKFFDSCRVDGNTSHKDLVCESLLSSEQLNDYRFSDTMARFKTTDILKSHGSSSVNLVLWKRDVYPVYKTNYKELDSIFWRGI